MCLFVIQWIPDILGQNFLDWKGSLISGGGLISGVDSFQGVKFYYTRYYVRPVQVFLITDFRGLE